MKITDNMRFPHPVLWSRSGDYVNGEFGAQLELVESLKTGHVTIQCTLSLAETHVRSLVSSGKAQAGLFISCLETYHNVLVPVAFPTDRIEVPGGFLRGRVIVRPIAWALSVLDDIPPENLHPEFAGNQYSIDKATVLALGEEQVIHVGQEKLSRMESIFSVVPDDEVSENQVAILLDNEKIEIRADAKTVEKIFHLRGTHFGRVLLLNSVYLPAVMQVLAALQEDAGMYESRRWYRIFTAKTDHLGIRLTDSDVLEAAQEILKSPFGRIPETIDWK
jgi:hypothetical protein